MRERTRDKKKDIGQKRGQWDNLLDGRKEKWRIMIGYSANMHASIVVSLVCIERKILGKQSYVCLKNWDQLMP